jgi:hypothetical protein
MAFKNLRFIDFAIRYEGKEIKLVQDLMEFGLIANQPEEDVCKNDFVQHLEEKLGVDDVNRNVNVENLLFESN